MSHTDFKNVKVIGFDLDQTLYPKSPEIDEVIRYPLKVAISNFLNIDIKEASKLFDDLYKDGKGLSGRKTLVELGISTEAADNLVQNAVENSDISKFLTPNKEIVNLLNRLVEKYKFVDLITGSVRKNALVKLDKLQIPFSIFKKIIAGDESSKSDLVAYKLWMSYYPDYKSENFLYIGDRVSSDYEKPKELGIKSILVNTTGLDYDIECLQLQYILDIQKYLI